MEILSYPVGLLVGVIQITVAFSSGESKGYLLLNGEKACDLTPSQNVCQVALGEAPRIHRLDLLGETPQGLVVKDTRWLNRGVLPAELRLVKTTGGKRCEVLLAYAHPNKEKAIRVLVSSDRGLLFDGPPRPSLAVDCEGSTFLSAEVSFADGLRAASVLPLSRFFDEASAAVYPWHVEVIGPEEQNTLSVHNAPFLAVEKGEAHLLVVAEPFSVGKLFDLVELQEIPAGDWDLRERTASLRAVRQLQFTGPLSESVAITLILAVEGFPRVEIPRSRDWLQRLLLASEELSQRFAKRPRRLWDATALAGYLASGVSRRRVVWTLFSTPGEDASRFKEASVQAYLRDLNVPLVQWAIGGRGGKETAVAKVVHKRDVASAFAALDRLLGRQVVFWLTQDPLAEQPPVPPAGYRRAGDYGDAANRQPEGGSERKSGGGAPTLLAPPGSPPRSPKGYESTGEALRLPIPPGFSGGTTRAAPEAVFQAQGFEPALLPVDSGPASVPIFVFIHPAFVADESLRYWKHQVSQLARAVAPRVPILLLPKQVGFGLEPVQLVNSEALDSHWLALTRAFASMPGLARRRAGYLEAFARNHGPTYRQRTMDRTFSLGQQEKDILLAALASLVDWATNQPGPAWLLFLADDLPMDPCALVAGAVSQIIGEPAHGGQSCSLGEEVGQLAAFLAFRGYSLLGASQTTRKPEARFFSNVGAEGSPSAPAASAVSLAGGGQELVKLLASATGGSSAQDRFQWRLEPNEKPLWALLPPDKAGGLRGAGTTLSLGPMTWAIRAERPEFWLVGPLHAFARGASRVGDLLDESAVTGRVDHQGSMVLDVRLRFRQGKEAPPSGPLRVSVGIWPTSGPTQWQQRIVETVAGGVLTFQSSVPLNVPWVGVIVEDLESGRWGGVSVVVPGR